MEASGGASRGNTRPGHTRRSRGHIEKRKSGSRRVKVYAGHDALLRKPLYLQETVPAGPDVDAAAERVREQLLAKVHSGRHPRSDATVDELLEYDLDHAKLGRKTRSTYRGYHRKHVRPLLGRFKINSAAIDPELLDSFYAELGRCRDHCDGKPTVRHWSDRPHRCDARCRRHVCRPLADWTIRKIHSMLNRAFARALRRRWVLANPMVHAEPPPPPAPSPNPPTVAETAQIIDAAWKRTYYGPVVWFATTTGARLGELCALRWRDLTVNHVDIAHVTGEQDPYECLEQGCGWVLSISRSIEQIGLDVWETDTKTHQHRRIALDRDDTAVLLDLRKARELDAQVTGRAVREDDFLFHHPKGPEVCLRPGAVSTHYSRFTAKLGIATTFHKLRHYTATELIVAGVDITTVAGRLGHSSPTTTLKFYSAWRSEADQRAATIITSRVPTPPAPGAEARKRKPAVFSVVAERLRDTIINGRVKPGEPLPTMKHLASAHRVSINSAHAAVNQLADWGYLTVSRGKRAVITPESHWPTRPADLAPSELEDAATEDPLPTGDASGDAQAGLAPVVGRIGEPAPDTIDSDRSGSVRPTSTDSTELLELHLRCSGSVIKTVCMEGNLGDPRDIQRLVRDMTATLSDDLPGVLELDIARFGADQPALTYVLGQVAAARRRLLDAG